MSDQDSAPQLRSAFDLFGISKNKVLKNFKLFAVLYLVPFAFTLFGMFSSERAKESNYSSAFNAATGSAATDIAVSKVAAIIGGVFAVIFVVLLIGGLYQAMLYRLELSAANDANPTFGDLWDAAKKYWWKVLLLSFAVAFIILGGLLLLIVPGLIMIRRYFLAPYVLVDQDVSIGEAMKRSAAMSKPHSKYVWSVIGVSILLSFTGLVPVVGALISFVLTMLYSVAPALRYNELKNLS